jgi:hypothetical protein
MSKKTYEVPVVYKGQCSFIVEAETPEQAQELAESLFNNGDTPTALGNEWENIERFGEITKI